MRTTPFHARLVLVILCVAALQLGCSSPPAFEFSVVNAGPERLDQLEIAVGPVTLNSDLLPGTRLGPAFFEPAAAPDQISARWRDRAGERQSHRAPWPRDDAGTPFSQAEIRLGGDPVLEVVGLPGEGI